MNIMLHKNARTPPAVRAIAAMLNRSPYPTSPLLGSINTLAPVDRWP